ncbi:hypothetical protein J2Z69_001752 [Paenibacillus shirakamiensis]|uniref:Spore germination protein n=1 Tax=Paenibacillus shirakamiensis TaxID=1265935 RepID=A0ABS4JG74_9BACL|nr:GerAB/ArcD/ProY family transporter [Paenibacillus shirakamiensis]MBP2000721.1 hypothetical protein [Paenibacillus shirakamiensis]
MVKNKYFYYLFLITALISVINYVPRSLIDRRFDGAMMSILISIPIGTVLLILFTKLMSKFPQQGLPEILNGNLSGFVSRPLLVLYSTIWFVAGLITILAFVDITMRYISSDVPSYIVILGFLLIICFSMRMRTESILYGLEVLLVLNLPLIIYYLLKGIFNPYFSWDAVRQMVTYLWDIPHYSSVAKSTFVFTGYINLAIFNRVFENLKVRHVWLISLTALVTLLIAFLMPIGFSGVEGISKHVYPWFTTADSLRTKAFIIERVLFLFYFTYLTFSLVSAITSWHITLELLKGAFQSKQGKDQGKNTKKVVDWACIIIFSGITLLMDNLNQYTMYKVGQIFLDVRLIGEIMLLATIFLVFRKLKRGRST